jgi:F420-0:gamma-glutamyl ligase
MNLNTIKTNLENTIAGKELFLSALYKEHINAGITDSNNVFVYSTMISIVENNLIELNAILKDVDLVITENKG